MFHIVRAVTAARAPDLQSEVVPCCDLAKRGPVAAVARLLPQRRKATIATSGENAAGKSSTMRSTTTEGMLSNEEFKREITINLPEPMELAWEVYEEDWLSFHENPVYNGVPLLSDTYIPPKDFTVPKRQPGQLLPVLPRDHSTRLYTVLTYGLRLCLCLTYRTRQEIFAMLTYLIDISKQGATLQHEARMQQLPDDIDLQRLRLGLELIGARVAKSEDGNELVLDEVLKLRPEQIRIPQRCWENAGKTQRIYTADVQQPLDRQLEELGNAVWRMTACVREVTPVMGNIYVPFLVGAVVVVPCPLLRDLLFVDYVGYIAGDQACQDAYSQLPSHAGNILACGDGREPTVKKAFRTLTASNCQLLQKLLQPEASTPPLLLLAAAEKNLEYKKIGEDLEGQLKQALEQGGQLTLRCFCKAVGKMLCQLAAGRTVEAPTAVEAQRQGPAEQLLQHAYNLLQERQTLEAKDLAMYAMNAMRLVGAGAEVAGTGGAMSASLTAAPAVTAGKEAAAGGEDDLECDYSDSDVTDPDPVSDLDWLELFDLTGTPDQVAPNDGKAFSIWLRLKAEHRITPLAWFPLAHQACKQLLQQHKQQLQEELYKELVTALAGLTGFQVLQDFVNSTKAAYLERQDLAAAHAETVTASRVEQVAGPTIQRLQEGIVAALPNRPLLAERHNPALPPLQQLLDKFQEHAAEAAQLGSTCLSGITAAACEAFTAYQEPLLEHCTAERCLAEGIKSLIPLDELAEVPNLLHKLDFKENSQSLAGPDKYGKQLVAHFKHDQSRLAALRCWLLDARTSTQEVVKTPAGCYLTPVTTQGGQQPFLQVPSSAEMQRLQFKLQQHRALSPVETARLKMAQLCEEIQAVVKSAAEAAAAETDPALQEMLLRQLDDVPKWMNESFGSCADLVRLQYNIVLPQMLSKLDCKILTSQAKRNLPTLRRLLLVQDQHEANMAAVSEVAADAVKAQVVACGERLLRELQNKLLNPVSVWSANSQWLQQQLQQAEGLSTVLRDITVLQCYLLARKHSNGHRAGACSSIESCNPSLKLPQVASFLRSNADEFVKCLYHRVLPTGEQLKAAAAALHKIAMLQLPGKADSSCHALLHVETDLLEQVATDLKLPALHIPLLGRLDPSSIMGLWLGALPEVLSTGELYGALCKQNTSSSNGSSEAAKVIGSDQYLKLVSNLLEKDSLPWKLQSIRDSIGTHLRHLSPKDKILLHQPVAALSVLQRVQLAQALFITCNNYKEAEKEFVHSQKFVDALVVPQRLLQDAAAPTGSVGGGSIDAAAPATAGALGNVMSVLEAQGRVYSLTSDSSSSSSGAVNVVRVVSKTLPFERQGVGAKQVVRLPVLNSEHQQCAVLHLDKACEYFMCTTRVYDRVKGSYAPTAAHLKVLDTKPPPVVLLAALQLLRQEGGLQVDPPQRQRGQPAPAIADSADPGRLLLPLASKAALKLEAAIKELAAKPQADSSLVQELVDHECWDVMETKQGKPIFVYKGTLPQELADAAAAAGCSQLPLAFNGSGTGWLQLLVFAQTGRTPSKKYLNGQNMRLLHQVGITADTAAAAQASAPAAAGTAPRRWAAGSSAAAAAARSSKVPAAGSSAAAAAAGRNSQSNAASGGVATGGSGRGVKRRAAPAAAAAAEQGQGTAAAAPPATKRTRSSRSAAANRQVKIGNIVAESPVFTEDASFSPGDVVELYITCKKIPDDKDKHLVKLDNRGAWYPDQSTTSVPSELYLTAAALVTATIGKHGWSYRNLVMRDSRGNFINWDNMKREVEAARAAAAAGNADSDSDSGQ